MCSYNKINQVYSCNDKRTMTHLRENLGFDGFVMSDWGAVHGPAKEYLPNGCDQEMGTMYGLWYSFWHLMHTSEKDVYTACHRIAKAWIRLGLYEEQRESTQLRNVSTPENVAVARVVVEQATVLLKNDNKALPIMKEDYKETGLHFLVLGNDSAFPITHGGGSGNVFVTEGQVLTPLQALCDELGVPRISKHA